MSVENPSGSNPSAEVANTKYESLEEKEAHDQAERAHIALFIREELDRFPGLNEAERAHVISYMHEHAGNWREFENRDIILAADPTIEDNQLVLIFSLYGVQEVTDRIPLF